MTLQQNNIDLLLQYILSVAGQEDYAADRDLGPIHLIKYVYLADLAFARRNQGATFTGISWKFYKFGPWSQEVNARLNPALEAIGAEKKIFPSDYGDRDEWVRWAVLDNQLAESIEGRIPAAITSPLRRYIHRFNKDTAALLHYVYTTKPMLAAAPNEYLDFSLEIPENTSKVLSEIKSISAQPSNKRLKRFEQNMKVLQERVKDGTTKRLELINPVKAPRFDDIYNEGIAWLNDLAGEKLSTGELIAEFSPEVWKSVARKGEDVP